MRFIILHVYVWLNQSELAEKYKTFRYNITMHISNIYKDKELSDSTIRKLRIVQKEGNRNVKRNI